MSYLVREIVYTIQGEGANCGRPAVFLRFGSPAAGVQVDLARDEGAGSAVTPAASRSALRQFASADELAAAVAAAWSGEEESKTRPPVVCTGGSLPEQLDAPLIRLLNRCGHHLCIEIDGSRLPPKGVHWVSVRPKPGVRLAVQEGDELKLDYPQPDLCPDSFADMRFRYFFLQPLTDKDGRGHVAEAVRYCLRNPQWRLTLQIHRFLGLP